MKNYQEIIKEICEEEKIKFTLLSKDFIIKLEKNKKIKYIFGYKFPLNDHAIGLVLDDKYATYEVLKNTGVKVVETMPIFENYNPDSLVNYLKKQKEIVIKSNNGTCGTEVFKVENEVELFDKVDFLLNKNSPICMMPFYHIKTEYRVIILNNQVKLLYGKKRPIIIGDGKKNIKELLQEFNYNYYAKENNLEKLNLDINKVLDKDLELEIDFKFNLSRGSNIFCDLNSNLKNTLENMALNITNTLNIKFASVDIIELEGGELLVLELNSGVMMDNFLKLHENGYEIVKNIYREAIRIMFD